MTDFLIERVDGSTQVLDADATQIRINDGDEIYVLAGDPPAVGEKLILVTGTERRTVSAEMDVDARDSGGNVVVTVRVVE